MEQVDHPLMYNLSSTRVSRLECKGKRTDQGRCTRSLRPHGPHLDTSQEGSTLRRCLPMAGVTAERPSAEEISLPSNPASVAAAALCSFSSDGDVQVGRRAKAEVGQGEP